MSYCASGNYTIVMPLNAIETDLFIQFAYTGKMSSSKLRDHSEINCFCNNSDPQSHAERIAAKLVEFAERGLFCNMAWHDVTGEIRPTHAAIMASRYNFISDNILTGSFVTLQPSVTIKTECLSIHKTPLSILPSLSQDLREKKCSTIAGTY